MGPDETNINRVELVFDLDNQSIGVPGNVKNNPITGQNIGTSKQPLHIGRRCPI